MEMTFDEYIQNPMGQKNAVYSHREMYRNLYKEKLDRILVREMGKIEKRLFKDANNFYVYMKIPSEVVPNFYYDVVIMFYTTDAQDKFSGTIKNYKIKFFSNDPSFVFTFAHSMMLNNLFINDLKPKMSKEAIKKEAVMKNPDNQIGYVKSLYFTYLIMSRDKLFDKIKYLTYGEKYDKRYLLSLIMDADTKIALRQEKGKENSIIKKKEENEKKEIRRTESNHNVITHTAPKTVQRTGRVKSTGTSKRATVTKKRYK